MLNSALPITSLASLTLLLGCIGCSQKEVVKEPPVHIVAVAAAAGPATMSHEQFRLIMDEMAGLDVERLALDLNTDLRPIAGIGDLSVVAAILAAHAQTIPQTYADVWTNGEKRRQFDQLAGKLRLEAIELGECARANDYLSTAARLSDVVNTCNACHSAFRPVNRGELPNRA